MESCSLSVTAGVSISALILGYAGYWLGWCINFVLKQLFGSFVGQYPATASRIVATAMSFLAIVIGMIYLVIAIADANASSNCAAASLRRNMLIGAVLGFYLALFSFRVEQLIRARLNKHGPKNTARNP